MPRNETVLTPATSKSNSLRTTVPMFIIDNLKLQAGDKLRWSFKVVEGKLVIIVESVK